MNTSLLPQPRVDSFVAMKDALAAETPSMVDIARAEAQRTLANDPMSHQSFMCVRPSEPVHPSWLVAWIESLDARVTALEAQVSTQSPTS